MNTKKYKNWDNERKMYIGKVANLASRFDEEDEILEEAKEIYEHTSSKLQTESDLS